MPEETELLQAILEAPDDDKPRLDYAAWLAEHGDPRGEFIRIGCQLAHLSIGDPEHTALQQRETELIRAYYATWMQDLDKVAPGAWASFWRGFPDSATAYDVEDEVLHMLARFPTIRTMELHGQAITADGLRHLQGFPILERLDLAGLMLTDEGLRSLTGVRSLRILSLDLNGLTAAGLSHLESLPELIVIRYDQEPGPEQTAALDRLKQLRMKRFRQRPAERQRQEARLVLESHGGHFSVEDGRVRGLSLVQSWVGDVDLEYIASFPEIESLNLYQTRITSAGLEHIT